MEFCDWLGLVTYLTLRAWKWMKAALCELHEMDPS